MGGMTNGPYNYPLGYLRAFVVVLVVAHHAALAYHPYAPAIPASLIAQPRLWGAFPVIDSQRGAWAALLTGFNDSFFMSLLFLVSGLFVWPELERRGSAAFLGRRALRLGLPFLVAAAVLGPLAYYPTYLQTPTHAGVSGFVRQWLALGNWPAGPAWFLWLLLVFDGLAALLFSWSATALPRVGRFARGHLFLLLVSVSAVVYVPLELIFSGFSWAAFGPFFVQTSRVLHYLFYFLIGAGIGVTGFEAPRRWIVWTLAAVVVFVVATGVTIAFLTSHMQSLPWRLATDFLFSVSCATTCVAFLAIFFRFVRGRSRVWDGLSRNSYGIYLLHYAFVSWLLLAMVGSALPASVKFASVLAGAVIGSWLVTTFLRRIPGVADVV